MSGQMNSGRRNTTAARDLEEAISRVDSENLGQEMMDLMARLFPICRSLTGDGVRETLNILSDTLPLKIDQVPTGYQAFDWNVPREWNIRDAYVKDSSGERIIDFRKSNLHILNYSVPFSGTLTREELLPHLHAKPELPEAIPYMTSYYADRWGFCLSQNQLDTLPEGPFEVLVDSTLEDGQLTFAEAILPGSSRQEILFSTDVCHPSMAHNELSGPILTAFLHRLISPFEHRYTYRFVFLPETIGSLVFLTQNGDHLRQNLQAGYTVTCVGDAGPYTYKRSRQGTTAADQIAEHCLRYLGSSADVVIKNFDPSTGSDERQYCSPGFDLPVGSLMRTMYGEYPEYHTSLDNLDFVSAEGMAGTLKAYLRMVQLHELNQTYINKSPYGEPQLGKRGLYPTLGAQAESPDAVTNIMYLLSYSDGSKSVVDIADLANRPAWTFTSEVQSLVDSGLLDPVAG